MAKAVDLGGKDWVNKVGGAVAQSRPIDRTFRREIIRAQAEKIGEKHFRGISKELLTVREAATFLRVSIDFVYERIRSHEIRVQPVGGKRLVPREELEAFLLREQRRFYG